MKDHHVDLPNLFYGLLIQYTKICTFARRKFLPILPPSLIGEIFLSVNFFPYLVNMVIFTALVKIKSMKCLCNTEVAGLGEIYWLCGYLLLPVQ